MNEIEIKGPPTPERHFEALADAMVRMLERQRFLVELREAKRIQRQRKRKLRAEVKAA